MRAYPETASIPKPLIHVGSRPVVHHVMDIFARHGFTDFVLAAGYMKSAVDEFASDLDTTWKVEVRDTGEETNTGARVFGVADAVGDTFFLTYADGLGNVDIAALLAFHRAHRGFATLTAVPLPSQYGTVDFDDQGRVREFREKPSLSDHYINGGFMVFDRRCFDTWPDGDDLERDVLPAFAAAGELFVYRHTGFWKSLDTYKDALELNALCAAGAPPWVRA